MSRRIIIRSRAGEGSAWRQGQSKVADIIADAFNKEGVAGLPSTALLMERICGGLTAASLQGLQYRWCLEQMARRAKRGDIVVGKHYPWKYVVRGPGAHSSVELEVVCCEDKPLRREAGDIIQIRQWDVTHVNGDPVKGYDPS